MKFNFKFFIACIIIYTALLHSVKGQERKITKENISSAEIILGLEFTDAERDSMINNLTGNLRRYNELHKINLTNNIPPALLFNPIPINFKINKTQKPIKFSDYSYVKLPVNKDDLAFYSIGELAQLIKTKKISSVELTKFFIERLKKFGPKLYCVITLTEERAVAEAKKADEEIAKGKYKGLLHGIPFGVKDLLTTQKYKTTWGAEPYTDQLIDEDATVIQKLNNAGAVLAAKFSMGALAMGDVWFGGMTRNPWDTTSGSSGSSAGSAAAVSAGLIPFAIGTETLGSIVSPSTVCGVTSLRPTYGRVSRSGAMALSWSMDKIGPLCRNTEDIAIVFNAIHGLDEKDQTLYYAAFNYSPKLNLKKLRVGYLKSDFDKKYEFHNNDSAALKKLEALGIQLIPIELPGIAVNNLRIILNAEAAAAFDELTRTNKDDLLKRQTKNAWPNSFRSSRFIPAVEYINANRIRFQLVQEMEKLFDKVDLYLAPSWQGNNLLVTNLTGNPCVVLPNGFSSKGTPTTFTFMGNLFDEGKLIAFAKLYQDATDHHKKHPKL